MKINTNWVKNNQTIKIPLCQSSFFNDDSLSISVNWGDGNSETVTSFSGANQITDDSGNVVCNLLTHTYNNGNGFKTITITGGYGNKIAFMQTTKQDANGDVEDLPVYGTRWRFLKIYECNTGTQFYIHGQGDFRGFGRLNAIGSNIASLISDNPASSIALSDASTATMFMDKTFFKCTKLRYFGQFDPVNVTSLQYTLSQCMKLDKCKAINNWDMEKVTIATGACKDSAISVGLWKWFMESEGKAYAIEDMSGMFEGADFNKGINGWDLSTVKDTSNMFKGSNFNKPIWKWFKNDNVLEKTDGMFQDNDDFSKDLSTWDISNVSSKVDMFDGAIQMSQAKVPDTIVLPSPTPTPSSSVTPTPTPSITPSITSSITPSATPGATPSVTPTLTPTSSVTTSSSPDPLTSGTDSYGNNTQYQFLRDQSSGTFNGYDNYTYYYTYETSDGYSINLSGENVNTDNEKITYTLTDNNGNSIEVYNSHDGNKNGFVLEFPFVGYGGGTYTSIYLELDSISQWPSS